MRAEAAQIEIFSFRADFRKAVRHSLSIRYSPYSSAFSALEPDSSSGPGGRRFESSRPDHLESIRYGDSTEP